MYDKSKIDDHVDNESELIKEIRESINESHSAFSLARDAARDDIDFDGGKQWDSSYSKNRQNRPMMVINDAPIQRRRVMTGWKKNRAQVKFNPVDSESDVETAGIMEGMFQSSLRNSMGDVVIDFAVNDMLRCGMGFVEITTEFKGEEFYQDIVFNRVKDPLSVYLDCNYQAVDYSDMSHGSIIYRTTKSMYKKMYGDEICLPFTNPDQLQLDTGDTVSLCKHYKAHETNDFIVAVYDPVTDSIIKKYKSEMDDYRQLKSSGLILSERPFTRRDIRWYICNNNKVLDAGKWDGNYIPLIPFLGDEYWQDGKLLYASLIRWEKDPARIYNYYVTAQAEELAMKPKAATIALEGSLDGGHDLEWATANRDPKAILYYKPVMVGGQPVIQPPTTSTMPEIPAAYIAVGEAVRQDKANTVGLQDPSLWVSQGEKSGKAILARSAESELNVESLLGNALHALKYMGVCYADLAPKIHDSERVVRVLGKRGEQKLVKINGQSEDGKWYDIKNGRYDVYVDTGPSFASQRKEAAESMALLAQMAQPDQQRIMIPKIIENLDFDGAKELSKILMKTIDPAILAEEDESISKEQALAQAEALNQENQSLKAQLEQMNQMLLANEQKSKMELEREAMRQEGETERTLLKHKTALDEQKLQTQGEITKLIIDRMLEMQNTLAGISNKINTISAVSEKAIDDDDESESESESD